MTDLPFSPAAANNRQPILDILQPLLAGPGRHVRRVLEIGSGTGQHAVHFARHLPQLVWQPSEQAEHLASLNLRLAAEAPDNLAPALALDVLDDPWPIGSVDAVFAANVVHIMSWRHVEVMFARLDRVLAPGGLLVLYGAYKYGGAFTTTSNERFDQWLRNRDPLSGVRDFEAVDALAGAIGLTLLADHAMPANNQCLVWQRR
jgi:SAM-dependent methyltransferase